MFKRTLPISADTLYVNARIYTMDSDNRVAEAMAVKGDRIVAVGSRSQLEERVRWKQTVDLEGRPVFPGFIDAHAHIMSLGIARLTVDLVGVRSESETLDRVRARVHEVKAGTWIRGYGWDQNDWPSKRFPHHTMLDRVAPENPAYLIRIDGHAAWVNRAALEQAGITRGTPDPEGGRIIRDASGQPTGVLIDDAKYLVFNVMPPPSPEEQREALEIVIGECLKYGITGVHDMGVDLQEIALYKALVDEGTLGIRIYGAISVRGETWDHFRTTGPLINYGDHRLTVRALKLYVDGALGSRGAALIDPYEDDPDNRGITVTADQDLQQAIREALQAGFQVCTHAIGDRGNNIALNAYEQCLTEHPRADTRFRVEHAQILRLDDIPRFKKLGVIPSMQPTHCTSDMYWAESRIGPQRIRGAYAWRSLRETGVTLAGGSDFPVEHPNPLYGIYAAVTRQDHQGIPRTADDVRSGFQLSEAGIADESAFSGGWYVDQKLTREEAVRMFTTWAAWAAFEEQIKGSLETGKLADFVVLSSDIMEIPPNEILRTEVEKTVVGGREVYIKASPAP
ncbi:MAG: amidohydrolase [Ignavibacteriales bacterium]|nr:amidohydrolase [Ignavibacteriales bacterium]